MQSYLSARQIILVFPWGHLPWTGGTSHECKFDVKVLPMTMLAEDNWTSSTNSATLISSCVSGVVDVVQYALLSVAQS